MKTPAFFLNLAILQALQVPSAGAQIAHFFGVEQWQGWLGAAALSFAYPVGCLVAWFGAVDRWGWNPVIAGVVFFAIFMATVLNTIVRQRFMRAHGVGDIPPTSEHIDQMHIPTSSQSGADKK